MRPLLPELLWRHAESRPDVVALASGEGTGLTYGEWWERSLALAGALARVGIAPGHRVALVGSNSRYEDMGIAYVGILLSGASVVPLSASQARHELDRAIAHAAPELVVTCEGSAEVTLPWRALSIDWLSAHPADVFEAAALRPDAPAEYLYTSGTTGRARLVEVPHGSMAWDVDTGPDLHTAPYHLVHALTPGTNIGQVTLRLSLTAGHTVVALEGFTLDLFSRLASTLPMQVTVLVPAMAARLAAEGTAQRWVFPAVEAVVVSGAYTPPATWSRLASIFPEAQLLNSYTTTEAWPARIVTQVDPAAPGSVGRPLEGHSAEIRDESGRQVGPFERGTIYLSHRSAVPRRYADGTSDGVRTRWIATDDVGYLDDEDRLFLVDRRSDVIETGGYAVAPQAVEQVLAQHPDVVEVAVLGIPHPTLGSCVAACVIGSEALDVDGLLRMARGFLASHEVPRIIVRRTTLPRTPSGKVAKRVLRKELARQRSFQGRGPRGKEEALVRTIWEEVLECPVQSVDAAFFAVGGDSLSALSVVARIRDELVAEIPVDRLLAASTIAEQAMLVAESLEQR
jgi:acyl-CoA synthetase (AMP-forming)/AMP-acid ligase II/acyl carrier protein